MNRKDIVMQIQMLMRQLFPSAEVILYGSEARNEARPDSDKTRKSVLTQSMLPDEVTLSNGYVVKRPVNWK